MWLSRWVLAAGLLCGGAAGLDPTLHRTVMGLREDYPALAALGSRLFHSPPSSLHTQPPDISAEDLRGLRFLLRFANLQDNMPVKQILDGASLPDLQAPASLSFPHILQAVRSNPALQQTLADRYPAYVDRQASRQAGGERAREEGEALYEECARDYDSFVAPITNPLTNSLLDECEDQPDPSVPCRNATLPDIPQYPGGRRSQFLQGPHYAIIPSVSSLSLSLSHTHTHFQV